MYVCQLDSEDFKLSTRKSLKRYVGDLISELPSFPSNGISISIPSPPSTYSQLVIVDTRREDTVLRVLVGSYGARHLRVKTEGKRAEYFLVVDTLSVHGC